MANDGKLNRRQFFGVGAGLGATALLGAHAPKVRRRTHLPSARTTVQWWGGVPTTYGVTATIDAFQKANPDITVNYTRFVNDPTGNTKLDAALQGGSTIDVYLSYDVPNMGQRVDNGLAVDITSRVKKDPILGPWSKKTPGIFRKDGKIYSLPSVFDAQVFMVNQTMAEQAGWKIPAKWTISQFTEEAHKLSHSGQYGLLTTPDTARIKLGSNYWYKDGGKKANFTNPAFATDWKLHRTLIEQGAALPWSTIVAQNLQVYPQNVFINKQVALWPNGSWVTRYLNDPVNYPHDFVTTFAPMPLPNGNVKGFNPGAYDCWFMIDPNSKVKDEAWEFMRFYLTKGARYTLGSGKVPAVRGMVSDDDIVDGLLGPDKEKYFDVAAFRTVCLDYQDRLSIDTIVTGAAEIQTVVTAQTEKYLLGEQSLKATVQAVQQQATAAIAKG